MRRIRSVQGISILAQNVQGHLVRGAGVLFVILSLQIVGAEDLGIISD